ncbi:MAG: hypothetical protein JRF63_06665 [Deltaproteobacteria bacterium]|nr:hypothetical protein [Deltaproteobacteria bacterium]
MTSCVGFGLLLLVIVGGIYLYRRVERLSQEIAEQTGSLPEDLEEEDV